MTEDSDFREIAVHFFQSFLELKVQLDQGLVTPKQRDKDVAQYRKLNDELKKACSDFAEQNETLENRIVELEDEKAQLRLQLNEAIMNLGRLQEKVQGLGLARKEGERTGYNFTELMDPESRRMFESLMREIPRPGH